jgi:Domain of unknown function (DUF4912)
MKRDELSQMKLEALRTLAAERGVPNARALGKSELVDALAAPEAPEAPAHATGARIAAGAQRTAASAHETGARIAAGAETASDDTTRRPRRPSRGGFDVPSSTVHPHADELETLTMARLYAAEGQLDRAIEIYEKLHALDGADEEVRAALHDLRGRRDPQPAPRPSAPSAPSSSAPHRPQEPLGMLDFEELPETYGVDECELLCKDPSTVFVYWEVTDGGLMSARAQLGPAAGTARLVLRLFTTADGGDRQHHDVDLNWNHGRRYVPSPLPGAQLRVAIGLLSLEGYFASITHSSLVRVPPRDPAPPGPVEWMEVVPGKSRGREREPLVLVRRGHEHAERGPGGFGPEPGAGPSSPARTPGGSSGSGSGGGRR